MRFASLFTLLAFTPAALGLFNKYFIENLRSLLPTSVLQTGIATTFVSDLVNIQYGTPRTTFNKLRSAGGSKRAELPARFSKEIPGSKTVKLKHGPYTIPNMNHKNGLQERGSLWNFPQVSVAKPCEKCVVFGINAGLEYEDGRNANIDTEAWLHHMVLFNVGLGRADQTCWNAFSALPHADVRCNPLWCERIFASGNERTPLSMAEHIQNGSRPAGYFVRPSDRFALIIDLMNDSEADKTVYLTMTYDYVEGWPENMDHIRPIWFDVDQCGISEVRAKHQTGKYTITAEPWSATLDGEILGYGGHLHDGGVVVNMQVDGVQDCASYATYGAAPEFVNQKMQEESMQNMDGGKNKGDILGLRRLGRLARHKNLPVASDLLPDLPGAADVSLDSGGTIGAIARARESKQQGSASVHISNMSTCYGDKVKTKKMKKGQKWLLTADYDYDKFKGSLEQDGQQGAVMGIVIMYVRQLWDHGKG